MQALLWPRKVSSPPPPLSESSHVGVKSRIQAKSMREGPALKIWGRGLSGTGTCSHLLWVEPVLPVSSPFAAESVNVYDRDLQLD